MGIGFVLMFAARERSRFINDGSQGFRQPNNIIRTQTTRAEWWRLVGSRITAQQHTAKTRTSSNAEIRRATAQAVVVGLGDRCNCL